jgi:hypothetical protein
MRGRTRIKGPKIYREGRKKCVVHYCVRQGETELNKFDDNGRQQLIKFQDHLAKRIFKFPGLGRGRLFSLNIIGRLFVIH